MHGEAATAADTDWPQIPGLYDVLVAMAPPGPVMTLTRVVALAMVHGPDVGLTALERAEPVLHGHHGIAAVRSHVLELAGRFDEAREQDTLATAATSNHPERRYLQGRAAAVGRRRATV